ncbi:zinc C3HC4 type (RING finger) [Micractinium conductrix]|uniref:RING-type E3 ubiquitin transferase n=1 Tax=Micractinium conductrix TaxID=554055 RepID=A0A2P6VER1_9CHLO|nr:zinc C3HC4 type (RING finger) [Micractinium conductrix]|eukprot:PSC72561.1 zinc C3HC4 type (RING finger) [Micractinium conductrix]
MTLLSLVAVATCLRAYALHEYARQLTELAMQEQASEDGDEESVSSGSGGAAAPGAGGGSAPARRRPRRPSLFTAVTAASRPLSLLNLRLSLMDRDFTERDFELLVRLDELEAATRQDAPPPPLPESQLAQLPVHVHRTPTKKGGQARSAAALLDLAAAGGQEKKRGATGAAAAAALQLSPTAGTPRVPVLVEGRPQGAAAAPPPAGCGGGGGGGEIRAAYPRVVAAPVPAAAAAPARQGLAEIVPAAPAPRAAATFESEGEEEAPLCSVCLEEFEDGAQILSLPCRHQYHAECVTQWLRLKGLGATCPNCKGTVFAGLERAAADQQQGQRVS